MSPVSNDLLSNFNGKALMKIRIAVAVNSNGEWSAAGWSGAKEEILKDCALEGLNTCSVEQVAWITVDVPVPQEITVEGEVEYIESV